MVEFCDTICQEISRECKCVPLEEDAEKHRKYYDIVLEMLQRKYLNSTREPQRQATALRLHLILGYRIHPREAAASLQSNQYREYLFFVKSMMNTVSIDMLVHGNMPVSNALKMREVVNLMIPSGAVPAAPKFRSTFRVLKLNSELLLQEKSDNANESNTACEMYFQIDVVRNSCAEHVIKLRMLSALIGEKFFDVLRTKEQLGYYVSCDWLKSVNVCGFHFTVKSPTFSAEHIEARIESFISRFARFLRDLPIATYEQTRKSVAKSRVLPPDNLSDETNRVWSEIIDKTYNWTLPEEQSDLISKTTKESLCTWFERHFITERRKAYFVILGHKVESKLDDVEAACAGSMDEDEESVEVEDNDESVGKAVDRLS